LEVDSNHALLMSISALSKEKKEQGLTEPGTNAARHDALWEVHRIGYSEHDQLCASKCRPVEEIIYHILLRRHQLV